MTLQPSFLLFLTPSHLVYFTPQVNCDIYPSMLFSLYDRAAPAGPGACSKLHGPDDTRLQLIYTVGHFCLLCALLAYSDGKRLFFIFSFFS
jgi:hypothetical protein